MSLSLLARPIAALFSDVPAVTETTILYLRLVPLAYGFQGILRIGATLLNVLRKPFHSSLVAILQTFGIYIPAASLMATVWGVPGIFISLGFSYLVAGSVAHLIVRQQISKHADLVAHQLQQTVDPS